MGAGTAMPRTLSRMIVSVLDRLGYGLAPGGPLLGYQLVKQRRLGYDRRADWRRFLSRQGKHTIFDVGAHTGESAEVFARLFPQARIYSFEPDPEVFGQLVSGTRGLGSVEPVGVALGDRDGEATLYVNQDRQTNSLLENSEDWHRYVTQGALQHVGTRAVAVVRIDTFCRERGLRRIDLLKIDAQGYELRILAGAEGMIRDGRIPLIYLEVNFVSYYRDQALFHDVYDFMLKHGYRLVGLYGSCSTQDYLISSDALFVLA